MSKDMRLFRSEIYKLICTRSFKIILLLITVVQCLITMISAKQYLAIGLDATPDSVSNLLEAIPPVEYLGFEEISFGTLFLIILGSLIGSGEFKQHSMRTTLLYTGDKKKLFLMKTLATAFVSLIVSLISVVLTITVMHITLGDQGLTPIIFNVKTWKFILLATISLSLLTVLAYAIGFLSRTPVVPLLFLIIQLYNVGRILAEKADIFNYLPVNIANSLLASSPSSLTSHPVKSILIMVLWTVAFLALGSMRFCNKDLGGEY